MASSLKKVPLSGGASPCRPLQECPPPPPGLEAGLTVPTPKALFRNIVTVKNIGNFYYEIEIKGPVINYPYLIDFVLSEPTSFTGALFVLVLLNRRNTGSRNEFVEATYQAAGGGGGGRGEERRPGTEKRCSHNLQSDPLGSGFTKGRENFH